MQIQIQIQILIHQKVFHHLNIANIYSFLLKVCKLWVIAAEKMAVIVIEINFSFIKM